MSRTPIPGGRNVVALDLGLRDFHWSWNLQKELQNHLVAAKRQDSHPLVPHALLTVEHPPVFTLGKSGNADHLIATPDELDTAGATFVEIDRGGDVTYHGPGQLVVYPILDLDRFYTDIHRYLRELEEVVIRTCDDFEIRTGRLDGLTGVWVSTESQAVAERKICAMGIRCSRWVTSHGLALNVNTDLGFFEHIVPCGIADREVTSIEAELGRTVDTSLVRSRLLAHFAEVFEAEVREVSVPEMRQAFGVAVDSLDSETA